MLTNAHSHDAWELPKALSQVCQELPKALSWPWQVLTNAHSCPSWEPPKALPRDAGDPLNALVREVDLVVPDRELLRHPSS